MIKKLIIAIVILIVLSLSVCATIDIEPKSIEISNALQGAEYYKSIELSSDSEQNVLVTAKVSDGLKNVVVVEPVRRVLVKDLDQKILVKFKGEKAEGHISFCFNSQSVSTISTEGEKCVGVKVKVDTSNDKVSDVYVNSVIIHDSSPDKGLDLEIEVENKGNLDEDLVVVAGDKNYNIKSSAFNKNVQHISVAHNFKEGVHLLPIKVLRNSAEIYSNNVEFQVKTGVLEHVNAYIEPLPNSVVNQSLKIFAILQSTGSGTDSTLKVDVFKDGSLVRHYEESGFIGTNEILEKVFVFTPVEKGRYTIQAQVFYGSSYGDMIEQSFNIVDSSEAVGLSVGYIGFLAIIIAVFIYLKRSTKSKKVKEKMIGTVITIGIVLGIVVYLYFMKSKVRKYVFRNEKIEKYYKKNGR